MSKNAIANEGKGLILSVYRDAQLATDFTLGGLTGRHERVTLVGIETDADEDDNMLFYPLVGMRVTALPEQSRVFAPTSSAPAVVLRYSASLDSRRPRKMHLAPVEAGIRRGMASGNYAGTTDSRLPELLERLTGYPQNIISVHDRFE
ncbi:hypothetical protein U2G91_26255 (plasmid) [Rhodococcoides fascians]|uniref:hypothetical protein n=1 Tax=Nocardiaceae TaxID=85025 RepID=UPI001AEB334F|nr:MULTISPECIES: hypothetical protein [Rhodococcus]MBP2527470.1 hypothetical protein [Rhodococcus sp. PvP104]WQH31310.1 hypothetical protein U2G91_26255 [Rhodococcus fascians]